MSIFYAFWPCVRRYLQMKVAEGVRFELTRPFGLPVFKTGAINRSATPPGALPFDFAIVSAIGNRSPLNKFVGQALRLPSSGLAGEAPALQQNCFSTARYVHVNLSHGKAEVRADR